jgi:hypothetical protein
LLKAWRFRKNISYFQSKGKGRPTTRGDWGVGGQLHVPACFTPEKKRLDGRLSGKDETSCPHRGSNPEPELIIIGKLYFRNVIHTLG